MLNAECTLEFNILHSAFSIHYHPAAAPRIVMGKKARAVTAAPESGHAIIPDSSTTSKS
jgi:hypothetical protein